MAGEKRMDIDGRLAVLLYEVVDVLECAGLTALLRGPA